MNSPTPAIGDPVITACDCPNLPENNRKIHQLEKIDGYWRCPNCLTRPFENYYLKSHIAS